MKRNSLEIADRKSQLIQRNISIISAAKNEVRELTSEEEEEFKANEDEISQLDEEQKELDKELEEEKDCSEKEEQKSQKNIIDNKMEKKNFSLIQEIRNSVKTGEQIVLDRAYTVASEGEDLVQTDVFNVIEPLRAKLALVNAGAHFMSGLKGDVQLPIMSAGNVAWAGETAAAADAAGSFDNIIMQPKRLTGYVEVSLQLLEQDTVGAEEAIRNDLIAAIAQKIESTVLGTAAGTTTQPAGLGNGLTPATIEAYSDLTDLEAELEEANVYGDMKYVVSPKVKAAFRSMIKGTNATGMVMEGNEIDGIGAISTSNVPSKKFYYGDFSKLYVGTWSNIILDVVRDSASLKKGCVTLVVNMYVDAKLTRDEAIVMGEVE